MLQVTDQYNEDIVLYACLWGTSVNRVFNAAPTYHCILPVIAEYTILKPFLVLLPSVTNDTRAVFPVLWTSLAPDKRVNVRRSGAEALFPS